MSKSEIDLKFAEHELPTPAPAPRVRQIAGMVETVDAEPSGIPRSFFEQIRIFSGALWFYDTVAHAWQSASAAVTTTFLALTDTPDNYAGNGGKLVRVNPGESALDFVDPEDVAARTEGLRVLDAYALFTERGMQLSGTGGGTVHMTNASMGQIAGVGGVMIIEAYTLATRTGGTSGSTGDSAVYITRAAFKNVGGTVSLLGTSSNIFEVEDQPGWNAELVVNANQPTLDLTGAANNNITWDVIVKIYHLT